MLDTLIQEISKSMDQAKRGLEHLEITYRQNRPEIAAFIQKEREQMQASLNLQTQEFRFNKKEIPVPTEREEHLIQALIEKHCISKAFEPVPLEQAIIAAKKAALHIEVCDWELPSSKDLARCIREMMRRLSQMKLSDLESFYKPYETEILELRNFCQSMFGTTKVGCVGRDSANRQFLTDQKIATYLKKPHIIQAILAISAAQETHQISLDWLEVNPKYELTLGTMLYGGFTSNSPLALESLPINDSKNEAEDSYLNEYLRRKHPEETFIPIIQALSQVYSTLANKVMPIKKHLGTSTLHYSMDEWPNYYQGILQEVLNKLQEATDECTISELIENIGKWSLDDLQKQSRGLIQKFCEKSQIKMAMLETQSYSKFIDDSYASPPYTIQLNFFEFVDYFSKSHCQLHAEISHNMDRLHLYPFHLKNWF